MLLMENITVLLCHNGMWGTVCGDISWDENDAYVVCRQLGFPVFENYIFSLFVDTPVFLSNVTCTGSEERLTDCSHGGFGDYSCNVIGLVQCTGVLLYILMVDRQSRELHAILYIFQSPSHAMSQAPSDWHMVATHMAGWRFAMPVYGVVFVRTEQRMT